jgi:hypothetical protein
MSNRLSLKAFPGIRRGFRLKKPSKLWNKANLSLLLRIPKRLVDRLPHLLHQDRPHHQCDLTMLLLLHLPLLVAWMLSSAN